MQIRVIIYLKKEKKMILYHGSSAAFDRFDLSYCKPGKDFGKGIYLTTNKAQAARWANLKNGHYLYKCRIRDKNLESLSHIALPEYNEEWPETIVSCRTGLYEPDADIISGRLADNTYDKMLEALTMFMSGEADVKATLKTIRSFRKGSDQYCFKTQKALDLLSIVDVELV